MLRNTMAEDNREFILKILEDLTQDEMNKLGEIQKGKKPEGYEIPSNKLENLDANKATSLFMSSYGNPLKALKCILDGIPRKDLTKKIAEIEAAMKNEDEAQNNEKFALMKSCAGSRDRPPYTGKYTLPDLQDYAKENQDQLIMHLENILESDGFNTLEKELMCSVLNKVFSFTAQKYYELFRNRELTEFLSNSGKSKKIPMKLLNILFSKKSNNRKRKAQEQMQREGNNINLKKKQSVNIDDHDDHDNNVPVKVTLGIKNEKTIRNNPIEHKPGNEDNNVIEDDWLDEDSRMAIENWRENKKKNYREKISLDYIPIRAHQTYSCFTAQDVLLFRLPDDTDERILAILQDKRDFTNLGVLKKEVEFALQFNMAVLNVKFSEVTSSKGFIREIRTNTFAESESFFKNVVFDIVLPLLALYKRVKLNAFQKAIYPN